MTDLSPQAQAVLDAFGKHSLNCDHLTEGLLHGALPAALEAAADQVAPEPNDWEKDSFSLMALRLRRVVRDQLLAIAAELRGQDQRNTGQEDYEGDR